MATTYELEDLIEAANEATTVGRDGDKIKIGANIEGARKIVFLTQTEYDNLDGGPEEGVAYFIVDPSE